MHGYLRFAAGLVAQALTLLLALPVQAERCDPYCSDGSYKDWIVVLGDTQIQNDSGHDGYYEETTGEENYRREAVRWVIAHQEHVAVVIFPGDNIGGFQGSDYAAEADCDTGSDQDKNLAWGTGATERYTKFQSIYYDPLEAAGIPFVMANGNHEGWEAHKNFMTSTNDWVADMEALPHVVDAGTSTRQDDFHYLVVDNYMGSQLIVWAAPFKWSRDDTLSCGGCPGGGSGCDGIGWWEDTGYDDDWFSNTMDSYSAAKAVYVVHASGDDFQETWPDGSWPNMPGLVEDDDQFILTVESHYYGSAAQVSELWTHGSQDLIYADHNVQWHPWTQNVLTVIRFDPDRQQSHVDVIDTRTNTIVRMPMACHETYGCSAVSADIAYTEIAPNTHRPPVAAANRTFIPDNSHGWASSDACFFDYTVGEFSAVNRCANPPANDFWYSTKNYTLMDGLRFVQAPKGFPRGSMFPWHLTVKDNEGELGAFVAKSSFSITDSYLAPDTTGSPEELVVDDFLLCYWIQSRLATVAEYDAEVSSALRAEVSYFIKWGNTIQGYFNTNAPGDYWVYQAGSAYSVFSGFWQDGDYHHECFAWGKDSYGSGGTGGVVELWRDGDHVTAVAENADTTPLADPGYKFGMPWGQFSAGATQCLDGAWGETIFLDISSLNLSEAELGQVVNHIRLCGSTDENTSWMIGANYPGTATAVLGPNGETSCSK